MGDLWNILEVVMKKRVGSKLALYQRWRVWPGYETKGAHAGNYTIEGSSHSSLHFNKIIFRHSWQVCILEWY